MDLASELIERVSCTKGVISNSDKMSTGDTELDAKIKEWREWDKVSVGT